MSTKQLPSCLTNKKPQIDELVKQRLDAFETKYHLRFNSLFVAHLLRQQQAAASTKKNNISKPRMTRKDGKFPSPPTSFDVATKVHNFEFVDADVGEPYIVYTIKSYSNGCFGLVYKRFGEIKKLHKMVGKKVSGASLPPDSTGLLKKKKNVTSEFAQQRIPLLQEYLTAVVSDKKACQMNELRTWLGLPTVAEMDKTSVAELAVETDAFRLTFEDIAQERAHTLLFGSPVEGLCKMLVSEVVQMLAAEIPKAQLKAAYRALVFDIAPVVEARWGEMSKQARQRKADGNAVELMLIRNAQDTSKMVIRGLIEKELAQYVTGAETILNAIVRNEEPTLRAIAGIYSVEKPQLSAFGSQMLETDPMKFDLRTGVEKIDKHIFGILEKLAKAISDAGYNYTEAIKRDLPTAQQPKHFEVLVKIFANKLPELSRAFISYITPRNRLIVCKAAIKMHAMTMEKGPANLAHSLEHAENEMARVLWRAQRDLKFDVWRTLYSLKRSILAASKATPGAVTLAEMTPTLNAFEAALEEIGKVEESTMLKSVYKFNDKLSALVKEQRIESFTDAWSRAFVIAGSYSFDRTSKHFIKHAHKAVVDGITNIFLAAAQPSVDALVMQKMKEQLQTGVPIPPPVAKFLDVPSLLSAVIRDVFFASSRPLLASWLTKFTASLPTAVVVSPAKPVEQPKPVATATKATTTTTPVAAAVPTKQEESETASSYTSGTSSYTSHTSSTGSSSANSADKKAPAKPSAVPTATAAATAVKPEEKKVEPAVKPVATAKPVVVGEEKKPATAEESGSSETGSSSYSSDYTGSSYTGSSATSTGSSVSSSSNTKK